MIKEFVRAAMAAGWMALTLLVHAPLMAAQAAPAAEVHVKGDVSGDWQGTLKAQKDLRIILRVTRTEKGWGAKFYSIDQGGAPLPISSITVDGSAVKFTSDMIGGSFEGSLSADGNTMTGTWTQGPTPLPLALVRATKETAWEIPAPAAPEKRMAADADPSFDVATIKPNDSGGSSMQRLTVNGRNFVTRNSSLGDLISFCYQVQLKQIAGAPDWINKDRYDIDAVPDAEGAPSPEQVRSMIRKLLASRFQLTFHKDTKELSAYVLTVAKTGQKLTPTEATGPLPGIGFRPSADGVSLIARNAAIGDFTGFLQVLVLDRPVVDKTGLAGKFDFTVKFLPDDSQFNGHPPPLPAKTDTTESAPPLVEAMQQQLGLKLEAMKTAVPVIVVDRVEKPSAN